MKIRISNTFTKNPSLWGKWKKLKSWQKAVAIPSIIFGTTFTLAYLKNRGLGGLIEDVKSYFKWADEVTQTGEKKEAIKNQEELSKYVQKVSNYGVYDKKNNQFVIDLETFIESEGTIENRLKPEVIKAINDYYELKKESLNNEFMYDFMNKLSTDQIQPLIDNIKELKNKFIVKGLEDKDPNRPKNVTRKISDLVSQFREKFDSKYKGTLKLNVDAEKRQKTNYEQPKPNYPTNF